MLSDTRIDELRKFNHADKLRAMQVLVTELSVAENIMLMPEAAYEPLTPYGNESAAQVLADFLHDASTKDGPITAGSRPRLTNPKFIR